MTPTERDDLNKRIAEDLGYRYESSHNWWHTPDCSKSMPKCGPHIFTFCGHEVPNFFTDPACTLLLMGKLLQSERTVISKHGIGLRRTTPSWEPDDAVRTDINKDIGEAVALAYAAMRNLK